MMVRLDEKWVRRLEALPESGMGYQVVDVTLVDGRTLANLLVFNAQDVQSPDSISFDTSEIARIESHAPPPR